MVILCGMDFSEASVDAATAASQLALKMQLPLHLVHSVDVPAGALHEPPGNALVTHAERQLRRQAERLVRAGARVETHVVAGQPDEAIRQLARELSASLIVMAALGHRNAAHWQLGSHADRTAQRSHIPVLVVRDAAPFEAWTTGSRPLHIVLGVDASLSSETAGQWITDLARFGACEVELAHLYWPPEEFHRLGLGGVRSIVDPDTEITRTLEQEYSERFAALFGAANVKCRLEPHLGRVGDGLASLANERRADLVVVGTHERGPLARVWEGSVSQRVLRYARTSVACIPAPLEVEASATRNMRCIVAATDFSKLGNGAIPLAYSIVSYAGTVHLVHVVHTPHAGIEPYDIFTPVTPTAAIEAARSRLAALVPRDAASVAARTQIHVVESHDPTAAICQAAERLSADVICLGTHGRGGLSRALLGSVAQGVLEHTHRPVLLARRPVE